MHIPSVLGDCTGVVDEYPQVDMTDYLARAMDKHGKDNRVKKIAGLVSWATPVLLVSPPAGAAMMASAYLQFLGLEGPEREWDIKVGMENLAEGGIILCGMMGYCSWVDYSTAGNIHFGYVAGRAKMNELFAGVVGGALELFEQALEGEEVQWSNCRSNSMPILCDNPGDQVAVDLGFQLAREYPGGIKPYQLHLALHVHGFTRFQKPPARFIEPFPARPEKNMYGPDDFNN